MAVTRSLDPATGRRNGLRDGESLMPICRIREESSYSVLLGATGR
jgi:hypothetical protein